MNAAHWLPAWLRRLFNQLRLAQASYKLRLLQDEIAHLQMTLNELPADIDWLERRGSVKTAQELAYLRRELEELPAYIAWMSRHEAAQAVIVARLQAAVQPVAQQPREVQQ